MFRLPPEARLLESFAPAFNARTFPHFLLLSIAAIVCGGRHTVSRLLWSVHGLLEAHPSTYHRVLSHARWSCWRLGLILAAAILERIPADQPVFLPIDDTTDGPHRGKRVYGKGCWRDAVRSSTSRFTVKWGHKWVVLAIRVHLPFCRRAWALPVLVALARKRILNRQEKHGHKSPADLGRQLLAVLIHWFPQRKFILAGDWGYGSHDLAWFCHRHRRHVTLVARCRNDLNLYALPPAQKRRGRGRRCRKGRKLPSPKVAAAQGQHCRRTVRWYGESRHEVELFSACGGWYRPRGHGRAALVPVRWVHVHDPATGRDDWFQSTDPTLRPEQIVELFAGRWSIEVTFEEVREHLGLESTRHWTANSVLRGAPCLLGLFSVVSLIFARLAERGTAPVRQMPCYCKTEPTFSDALFGVRRLLWSQVILKHGLPRVDVTQFRRPFRQFLLERLAEAA
jgi:hypothetical protein